MNTISLLIPIFLLYGCFFSPVEEVKLLKEYVFVEKRDGGRCVDSMFVLFTCAEIDTTDAGEVSIKLYGLYRRKIYYDNKLIYRHIDSVRLWHNITFWRFENGCVCREASIHMVRMFGEDYFKHFQDETQLFWEYSLWGIAERSVRGIYGGCLGELSYYELVSVRDLALGK